MSAKMLFYYVYGSKKYDPVEHAKAIFCRDSKSACFERYNQAKYYADKFNEKHTNKKLYVHKITLNIDYIGIVEDK